MFAGWRDAEVISVYWGTVGSMESSACGLSSCNIDI